MQDLIDRLREYASIRKGELAELITEAVEALERQTCDDVVSRQQVIDVFKKELTTGESKGKYVTICSAVSFEGAKQILEALPSVQPERKWIPCSNPPKHHKDVIVRGIEAIGNVTVHKVMQWDVDTWRPTDYAPSVTWKEWSEI